MLIKSFSTFENIATGVLFAEDATIGGWQFNNNYIRSASNLIGFSGYESADIPFLSAGDSNNPGFADGKPSNNGLIRMYSTGTIIVGKESNDSTKAGISGRSDALVNGGYQRFWAGSGRNIDGPFYVLDNGFLKASNANITGNLTCNSLTVANGKYGSYGGPGVVCICHYNGSRINNVYSTNGKRVSSIKKGDTGYITITHNMGNTSYICFAIGNVRSDSKGFIGSSGITSFSSNSCVMHLKNTDNKDHTPASDSAIDIIFLSY